MGNPIGGVLSTDGGPHAPAVWAYASARCFLDWMGVDPNASAERQIYLEMLKDDLRGPIAKIFLKYHEDVQKLEREALAKDAYRWAQPGHLLDANEHVETDKAVNAVYALIEPLLEKSQLFVLGMVNQPDKEDYIKGVILERLHTDLRTSMQNERSWHQDKVVGAL